MGPQRRSSDTTPPLDAVALTAPAPQPMAHPAAGFHVTGRDAFRDKAEREARRRAEQAARRMAAGAAVASAEPSIKMSAPSAKVEPLVTQPGPPRLVRAAFSISAPGASRPTAAIIPWPRRERVIASTDAPPVERPPPEVDVPKVDAPRIDPKPASGAAPKSAPFNSAEFWGSKKKTGGGGGGGNSGGGTGGASGGAQKDRPFNQDDVAGAVIVLLILLLGGWMLINLGDKRAGDDRVLKPQTALNTPAPPAPVVKPDPFPPGPVDLKPKSPIPEPEADPAKIAPPLTSEPVVTAQATPSPPSPAAQPARATCASGRMIHAYFCTSRSDLTPAARAALDADMKEWRGCFVDQELVVKGYADTRGSQEFNTALGENRAKQLAEILRAQGLNVSAVVGVGKLEGLDDGQNCLNQRRVDVGLKSEIDAATPSKACAPPRNVAPILCGSVAPKSDTAAPSPAR